MASFNSAMPSTFVYFEALPLSIAFTAACLILSGVSKSGSPAPRPITLRPASLSARALSVTAMVADGLMRFSWSARKAIEILLCRSAAYIPVVMRTAESSKGRFGEEIRSIRSVLPIILPGRGTQTGQARGFLIPLHARAVPFDPAYPGVMKLVRHNNAYRRDIGRAGAEE